MSFFYNVIFPALTLFLFIFVGVQVDIKTNHTYASMIYPSLALITILLIHNFLYLVSDKYKTKVNKNDDL